MAVFLAFALVACDQAPLKVSTPEGKVTEIPVTKSRPICAMATWCPYSKQFRDTLNDARLKPYLKGIDVIFLLEESEWPTIEKQLREQAKEEGLTEDDIQTAMTTLKAKAKFASVFDPDFFDPKVAEHYFAMPSTGIKFRGFPSMLSVSNREFGQHPVEWLREEINVPNTLLTTIWESHTPEESP